MMTQPIYQIGSGANCEAEKERPTTRPKPVNGDKMEGSIVDFRFLSAHTTKKGMQMKQAITKLTMREVARSHDGPILRHTDPVFFYEVDGMPNGELVQILNLRAHGRTQNWEIRFVATDAYTGDYKTAEEALAALQTRG